MIPSNVVVLSLTPLEGVMGGQVEVEEELAVAGVAGTEEGEESVDEDEADRVDEGPP